MVRTVDQHRRHHDLPGTASPARWRSAARAAMAAILKALKSTLASIVPRSMSLDGAGQAVDAHHLGRPAGLGQRVEHAEGHDVVGASTRRRSRMRRQQLGHRLPRRRLPEVADARRPALDAGASASALLQARRCGRGRSARPACPRWRRCRPGRPALDQGLGRGIADCHVVGADEADDACPPCG